MMVLEIPLKKKIVIPFIYYLSVFVRRQFGWELYLCVPTGALVPDCRGGEAEGAYQEAEVDVSAKALLIHPFQQPPVKVLFPLESKEP